MTDTLTMDQLTAAQGQPVYSQDGEKIGKVEEIFHDIDTNQPEWIGVGTGMFSSKRVLVPVKGAEMRDDGFYVPYSKDHVSNSPDVDSDEISQETEAQLYSYYGIEYGEQRSESGLPESGPETTTPDAGVRTEDQDELRVSRTEEELNVGTRAREAGGVRLKKWVETEQEQVTVPTRKERVSVERVPVSEGTTTTGELGEDEVSVPVMEEEVVVEKKPVAKEEVRVSKEAVTEDETVSADVRKEKVDIEDSSTTTGTTETVDRT